MSSVIIVIRYTIGLFFKFITNLLLYPFSRNARHRMSAAYEAMSFSFYGRNFVDLSELLSDEELSIVLAPVKSNKHNTSAFELAAIASLVKDKQCNQIFEIGTFDGRSTRAMALNLKDQNGKIITLNLPPDTNEVLLETGKVDVELASKVISGERFLQTAEQRFIEQVWGDSATFDFSPYYCKMDFVFIDGAHSESYVESDTMHSLRLIKPEGGWIAWHDAPYFGVVKFLKQWAPKQEGPVYFIKGTSLALAYIRNGKVAKPVSLHS